MEPESRSMFSIKRSLLEERSSGGNQNCWKKRLGEGRGPPVYEILDDWYNLDRLHSAIGCPNSYEKKSRVQDHSQPQEPKLPIAARAIAERRKRDRSGQ